MILAAGYGTRMKPLSLYKPKALFPIHGTPSIDRILQTLGSWGVRDALVNIHSTSAPLFRRMVDRSKNRPRVQLSYEPEILGTGGALTRARWFIESDPFWLVNGDIVFHVDPRPFLAALQERKAIAALWCGKESGPRSVESESGLIRSFRAERPGTKGTVTFQGLHLVRPELLDFLPSTGFSSIITAYELAMKRGLRVASVEVARSSWRDIGTPEGYFTANADADRSASRSRSSKPVSTDMADLSADIERALGRPAGKITITPMTGRGSDRAYIRLSRGDRSVILMRYGTQRGENARFAELAGFLEEAGITTPKVIRHDIRRRFCIVEDVGDISLYSEALSASNEKRMDLYCKAIDLMADLHIYATHLASTRRISLEQSFGPALFRWEHDLFFGHFVQGRDISDNVLERRAREELRGLARSLNSLEKVLLHRDFQSSNIHLVNGAAALLDFQGMRFGPAAYDLASLLLDPYVMPSDELRDAMLRRYARKTRRRIKDLEPEFWRAGVQRMTQAIGAYGRLARLPETRRFEMYIQPALAYLLQAQEHAGGLPALAEIARTALLERR